MSEGKIYTQSEETINTGHEVENGVETVKSESNEAQASKSIKQIIEEGIDFVQKKILTPKVCKIIELCFKILLLVLSVIQVTTWGLKIKNTYATYVDTILNKDYVGIAIIAFELVFVIAFLFNIVKGVINLIKKTKEPQFETLTTLYAFNVFSMLVKHIFHGKQPLINDFTFKPIMTIMIVLLVGYSLVRLISPDFMSRIVPLIFSGAGIFLARFMFNNNIGNFVTFSISEVGEYSVANLSAYRYIRYIVDIMSGDISTVLESLEGAVGSGAFSEISIIAGSVLNCADANPANLMLTILIHMIIILVENILPFAALSMLGYFLYCLTASNYLQYYKLEICRKLSVNMLVVAIISVLLAVASNYTHLIFGDEVTGVLSVNLNISNIILTMVTLIAMIVVCSMPWKLYSNFHIRRHQKQIKSEGGR